MYPLRDYVRDYIGYLIPSFHTENQRLRRSEGANPELPSGQLKDFSVAEWAHFAFFGVL